MTRSTTRHISDVGLKLAMLAHQQFSPDRQALGLLHSLAKAPTMLWTKDAWFPVERN